MTSDNLVDEVAQAIVLADDTGELSRRQAVAFARAAVQKIRELRLRVVLDLAADEGLAADE